MDYLPDELILRKLGWEERNPGIWENKLDDYHNVYIAFNKDRRGFAYAFNSLLLNYNLSISQVQRSSLSFSDSSIVRT